MKKFIAVIADTQLHKRLYGLQESRKDWLDAFDSAIEQLIERISEVSAIIMPGDILDKEEIGSHAAYTVINGFKKLSKFNVPVILLLGNHDQPEDARLNWVRALQIVNPNIIEPSLSHPTVLEGGGSFKPLCVYGSHHLDRAAITKSVREIKQVATDSHEHWLVLHEALKELAPHPDAYEISAEDVPQFISKVILGDFHDFDIYTDKLGRQFIYAGSTETVSFNQTKTPGFILINRENGEITHLSTQQREYLTFKLSDKDPEEWEDIVLSKINSSIAKFNKSPVVRIYYPASKWEFYSALKNKIKPSVLKLFDYDEKEEIIEEEEEVTREARVPTNKEEIVEVASEEVTYMQIDYKDDVLKILNNPSALSEIQKERFPNVQFTNDSN